MRSVTVSPAVASVVMSAVRGPGLAHKRHSRLVRRRDALSDRLACCGLSGHECGAGARSSAQSAQPSCPPRPPPPLGGEAASSCDLSSSPVIIVRGGVLMTTCLWPRRASYAYCSPRDPEDHHGPNLAQSRVDEPPRFAAAYFTFTRVRGHCRNSAFRPYQMPKKRLNRNRCFQT